MAYSWTWRARTGEASLPEGGPCFQVPLVAATDGRRRACHTRSVRRRVPAGRPEAHREGAPAARGPALSEVWVPEGPRTELLRATGVPSALGTNRRQEMHMGLGSLFAFPGGARGDQPQSLSLTPQLPICHLSAEAGGPSLLRPWWLPVWGQGWPKRKGVGWGVPHLLCSGDCHALGPACQKGLWETARWALGPAGGPAALLGTHTSPPMASSGTWAPAHLHSPRLPARPRSLAATAQQPLWPQPGPGRPPPRGP